MNTVIDKPASRLSASAASSKPSSTASNITCSLYDPYDSTADIIYTCPSGESVNVRIKCPDTSHTDGDYLLDSVIQNDRAVKWRDLDQCCQTVITELLHTRQEDVKRAVDQPRETLWMPSVSIDTYQGLLASTQGMGLPSPYLQANELRTQKQESAGSRPSSRQQNS